MTTNVPTTRSWIHHYRDEKVVGFPILRRTKSTRNEGCHSKNVGCVETWEPAWKNRRTPTCTITASTHARYYRWRRNPEELHARRVTGLCNDFYRPDLQAVIVVGDVDAAKIEAEIQRLFNPIEASKPEAPVSVRNSRQRIPLYAKPSTRKTGVNDFSSEVKQIPASERDDETKPDQPVLNQIMEKYLRKYVETQNPSF